MPAIIKMGTDLFFRKNIQGTISMLILNKACKQSVAVSLRQVLKLKSAGPG